MRLLVGLLVLLWSTGAAAQQYGEDTRAPAPSGGPTPLGDDVAPPDDAVKPPPGAPIESDPAPPPEDQLPPLPQLPASARPPAPPPSADTARQTANPNVVKVVKDERGYVLLVDGTPTMVYGMNWAYMPIGENYTYDFWNKPDDFIVEALHDEMTLLLLAT